MRFEVNIYVATTWRSPRQKEGSVAWLVEFPKKDGSIETRPREGPGVMRLEGTEAGAVLSALIEALKILTKSCEIHVYTLNERILTPLKNGWLEAWKINNFQNQRGKTIKNSEKWRELEKLTKKHTLEIVKGLGEYRYILNQELAKSVENTLKGAGR